ncbi:MAG TPA: hypothetical protein PLO37_21055 [Candidatus Hydrogenedentes bacterium]|nr:hypothetical protein [Candidatus Hydrogenedentota bacterium]HPG69343.1 hypothetical protein [Candidatus Hydrogenedentota bacterium]
MTLPWDPRRTRRLLRKRNLTEDEVQRWIDLHRRTEFARRHIHDRAGRPWKARPYQASSLESWSERKVHCDGRDVGKTAEIEIIAAWAMVARPDSEMLIATQCENHLFPLMNRLWQRFNGESVFAAAIEDCRRSPSWYFRFSNGFVLWGRIAGPNGVNFQGMHVDWQIVDEAQEMTETAWGELFQGLNGGGRRWVYGVPNGLRNTFHRMTQMQDAEQYNWPSSLNPEFTDAKDAELALLYGGRSSPGYLHRVLGQHGTPAHAVFNLDDYLHCVDDGADFVNVALGEEDPFEPDAPPPGAYYLGCDLGYARDPSEMIVYRADEPHFVNVLRLHLEGVNYARQQDLIARLDAAYGFCCIGIDCGNSGRAVAHNLMGLGEEWCAKVRAFDFGATLDLAPLPDGSPNRRRTKQFMTELLERRMTERTIVFPRLPDRESQYASHTYSVGLNGQIVYDKGDDHVIDADRCAILAHYLDTHDAPEPVSLGVRIEGF